MDSHIWRVDSEFSEGVGGIVAVALGGYHYLPAVRSILEICVVPGRAGTTNRLIAGGYPARLYLIHVASEPVQALPISPLTRQVVNLFVQCNAHATALVDKAVALHWSAGKCSVIHLQCPVVPA